jgi:predicted nucleotidyltransferase
MISSGMTKASRSIVSTRHEGLKGHKKLENLEIKEVTEQWVNQRRRWSKSC